MTKAKLALMEILLDEWEEMTDYEVYDIRERMEETVSNIVYAPTAVYWKDYRKRHNVRATDLRNIAEKSGNEIIEKLLKGFKD